MKEDEYLGLRVGIISKKIEHRIGNAIHPYGLSNIQGRMIKFLHRESKKRDIFQKDLEQVFHIRGSSVTSVLNLMEENDLIERVSVKKDGRLKKIVLKEKGYELYNIVEKVIKELEEEILTPLTDSERKELLSLLDKVNTNFIV